MNTFNMNNFKCINMRREIGNKIYKYIKYNYIIHYRELFSLYRNELTIPHYHHVRIQRIHNDVMALTLVLGFIKILN